MKFECKVKEDSIGRIWFVLKKNYEVVRTWKEAVMAERTS